MLRNKYDYDIFILGGGTAGVDAALTLAAEGRRVGLSEPGELGGYETVSGYNRRAPLLAAARLYTSVKHSTDTGIRGGSVGYNYPTLRESSNRTYEGHERQVEQLLKKAGVRVYPEAGRFIGPHEVTLGRQHVSSAHFLICTGSREIVPSTISGLESVSYLTPRSAVDLLKPPKSIFIIGGGKTGVEFADLFSSFGSHVSIAEIAPRLLPDEDIEAGEAISSVLSGRSSDVLTSARITTVSKEGTLHRITYLRGDVEHVVKAEAIMLAAGRTPNVDLGLENADVDYSPIGISVSATLQTSAKHIYSAGSVTGNVRSAEGALLEADAAVTNLFHRDKVVPSYAAVPTVVYTQPSVARVGVNEGEALRKDILIRTSTASIADTTAGRASRDDGLVKLVADRKGIIIGATIIGTDAAEAINALTLAIDAGMPLRKIARLPFSYGSTGEAVIAAAHGLI